MLFIVARDGRLEPCWERHDSTGVFCDLTALQTICAEGRKALFNFYARSCDGIGTIEVDSFPLLLMD